MIQHLNTVVTRVHKQEDKTSMLYGDADVHMNLSNMVRSDETSKGLGHRRPVR